MDYVKVGLPRRKKTEILALGAQSKASFCFLRRGVAYLSKSGGNLGELENLELFEKRLKALKRKLKARPEIIACDLHPEYVSTKLANEMLMENVRLRPVQHHEAHIASSIADNSVKGNVIGVAFDGTGFGLDGNIWGGEFFAGNIKGFKRVAHLRYIPMPGGEASIKEPWRMAASYLYNIYGARFKNLKVSFLTKLDKKGLGLLVQIIDKRINSPFTSSVGRLFDAVSSLAGVCNAAEYEGQAAIELEKIVPHPAHPECNRGPSCIPHPDRYSFDYKDEKEVIVIDWTPLIKGVIKDLQIKKDAPEISLKFHNAICNMIKDSCNLLRKKYKIDKVCLSGGVFQNRYLKSHVRVLLEKENFKVYLHKRLPTHDGNIALGQAVLAGV